ncbi:MAG: yedW1 [Myxococcales bacterium]|nr:yedW1 [Myxococcales bacterium]
MHVLIALADVGPGVQLEEALNGAGMTATWDGAQVAGPTGTVMTEVVVLDADRLGKKLAAVADAWRDSPSVPGVIAIGTSAQAREYAPAAKVTLLSPAASIATLKTALHEAAKLRLTSGMRWPVMRTALGLPPAENTAESWAITLTAARRVDLEIARAALRWHAQHYATPAASLDYLRSERLLTVPELETAAHIDGTSTIQRLVKAGPLDPLQSVRLLWTLASLGAIDLTPEVRDVATPQRRMLHELRAHLRARAARLEHSTYYDVLEITVQAEYLEIEDAHRLVGARFSPQVLARFDLAELAALVKPSWDLVEKARTVLIDHAQRGRYHDWLRQKLPELKTVWAIEPSAVKAATEAFARGQKLLGEGDVHRAITDFATACRNHPGHPDYEANLAWARFRVQVASGKDQREAAISERKLVEGLMQGCRPWPRALVALAMLCAAAGDPESARWHIHVALTFDPKLPAAVALAQRLGLRR